MSTAQRVPMTPTGHAKLRAALKDFKEVQRPANVLAIEEARAHGDLRENAEYHAAKEKQAMIAAMISDIEDKLSRAEVVDPTTITSSRIQFGATVTLQDEDSDEEIVYKIVGGEEADAKAGLISYDAPLARALIGKEEGDTVRFDAPKGKKVFEVLSVTYK